MNWLKDWMTIFVVIHLIYILSIQGHVCFLEFTFRETTFQTFLCLFAIRKVGQRKTLSRQRKHFLVNENTFQSKKNLVQFLEKCFPFWLCLFSGKWFPGNHFLNFPVFVCHQKSWSTENTFQSKENLAWFSGKCFPEKFGRKTLSGSCEKFRNVIIC